MFIFVPLVGSNITRRSLRFTDESLKLTNRFLDAATKSLDLTNKLSDLYFGPLLYTKVCLPLEILGASPTPPKIEG